jgi:hypothetical protein
MDQKKENWRENLYNVACDSKYLFQGPFFAVSSHYVSTRFTGKIIKNYRDNTVVTISSRFSQFDLAVSLAIRKIISQRHQTNIEISLADIIHAMRRFDGGNTRQLVLNSIKKIMPITCILNLMVKVNLTDTH